MSDQPLLSKFPYPPFCQHSLPPLPLLNSLLPFYPRSPRSSRQVLSLGVPPSRILFANPCKMPSHVRYAASRGVEWTTFDSEAELHKVWAGGRGMGKGWEGERGGEEGGGEVDGITR